MWCAACRSIRQGGGNQRLQREDLLLLREGLQSEVRREPGSVRQVTTPATEVVDPVCGMTITPEDSVGSVEYGADVLLLQELPRTLPRRPEAFVGAATPRT